MKNWYTENKENRFYMQRMFKNAKNRAIPNILHIIYQSALSTDYREDNFNYEDYFYGVLLENNSTEPEIFYNSLRNVLPKNSPLFEAIRKEKHNIDNLTNQSILNLLTSQIPYSLTNTAHDLNREYIMESKQLLVQLFDRLNMIGFIDYGVIAENKNLEKYGIKNPITALKSYSDISNLDIDKNPVDILLLTLYYTNKLSKINENCWYYMALENFSYQEHFEEQLKEHSSSDIENLPEDLKKYLTNRNKAENIGLEIISTLNYLRGNNSNPKSQGSVNQLTKSERKCDSWAYLISTSDYPIKSFSEFLLEWKEKRNENGSWIITENDDERLNSFYESFNKEIDNLQKQGISLEKITDLFIFTSRMQDLNDNLYEIKHHLLQHIIEYSQQPGYKNNLLIQYHEKVSIDFDTLFEIWKNNANRDNNGLLKQNLNIPNVSTIILNKFNTEINKIIKNQFPEEIDSKSFNNLLSEIKNGMPNSPSIFQELKNNVNKFIEGKSQNSTEDTIYILKDNFLFPLSFHTNIRKLLGVKERLTPVNSIIKQFSTQENINIPYILENSDINALLESSAQRNKEMNVAVKENLPSVKIIGSDERFAKKETQEMLKEFMQKSLSFIDLDIHGISTKNLLNGRETNVDEIFMIAYLDDFIEKNSPPHYYMNKKILIAKIASFILKRKELTRLKTNDPLWKDCKDSIKALNELVDSENQSKIFDFLEFRENIFAREEKPLDLLDLLDLFRNPNNTTTTLSPDNKKMFELEQKLATQETYIQKLEYQLQQKNSSLSQTQEALRRSNSVANKLLLFADKVKSSAFGKFFFRKELKKLQPGSTTLDDSDDR